MAANKRLLTPEEALGAYNKDEEKYHRIEWHRSKKMLEAQEAKTLKEVGKWLEENGGYEGGVFNIGKTAITQLKQGKLPE